MLATPTRRREPILTLICLGAAVAACSGSPSALAVTRMELQVQSARNRLEGLRRDHDRLELQIEEDEAALASLEERAIATRAELKERSADLQRVVATLQAAEEDLAAARRRQKEIAAEMAGVRKAEEELAGREQRLKEIAAARAAADAKVAEAEAALATRQQAVEARLAVLQEKGAGLDALDAALESALARVMERAGPFQLPPAPAQDFGG